MRKECDGSRLVGVAVAVLVVAATLTPALAQPSSTRCQQAKQLVASLQQQIETLKSHRGDPQYEGSASTLYLQKMRTLNAQLVAANALERDACSATGGSSQKGSLIPKYMILALIYAPPGDAAGKGASAVDYGSGSTFGTSVATSNSYKNDLSLSLSVMGGFFGNGVTASVGFGWSVDETDKNSVDFKKAASVDIRIPGPAADGINHDEDRIYLWLNPRIDVALNGNIGTWTPSVDGNAMDVQYVHVGWLKNPQSMPADLAQRLAARGLTASDFQTILAVDPFANGATAIDSSRFFQTATTFPYEPPFAPTDPPSAETYAIKSESSETHMTTTTNAINVSVGVKAEGGVAGTAKVTLEVSDKFTWTHSSSAADSEGSTQAASVTIGQPSAAYTGATDISVYWDRIFGTFMFAPAAVGERIVVGTITDRSGKPLRGQEVLLAFAGRNLRTFTDVRGRYRFIAALPPRPIAAQLRAGRSQQRITVGRATLTKNLSIVPPRVILRPR